MNADIWKKIFQVSGLRAGSREFLGFLFFTWMSFIFDSMDVVLSGVILGFIYSKVFLRFEDERLVVFYRILAFGIGTVSGLGMFLPILGQILLMFDQKMLPDWVSERLEQCVSVVDSSVFGKWNEFVTPVVGANNEWMPDAVREFIRERSLEISSYWEEVSLKTLVDYSVEAQYLRGNDVSPASVDISDKPFLHSDEVYQKAADLTRFQRLMVWSLSFGVALLIFRNPYLVSVFLIYLVVKYIEGLKTSGIVGVKGAPMRSGVYHIITKAFGMTMSFGVGVVFNGVMHVPHHVSGSDRIRVGSCWYAPYYVNIDEDLVTYGGPPQFVKPRHNDTIYVNCESKESRTSYKVRVDTKESSRLISWHGVTRPGESGSPVFSYDGEKLLLVGLAGRYYRGSDGVTTEYANVPFSGREPERVEGVRKVVLSPGSGKTFRRIPEIITDFVARSKKRVLVTGPTRVVCQELCMSLKRHFRVGMNVKDQPHLKDVYAPVQVAAHASALRMLLTGAKELRGLGLIVIDEAHFDDASTIMLRNFGKFLVDEGIEVVELSATLDGEIADGSNHPIEDHKVTRAEAIEVVKSEVLAGNKTMVFVPSITGSLARSVMNGIPKDQICRLSRATFSSESSRVSDPEVMLIVTTDISECGINVPGLINVVDFGEKFGYVLDNGCIVSRTYVPGKASVVQRRGRVGRESPGHYFYVNEPSEDEMETSARVDAQIMMTGRKWAYRTGNPLNMYLTEEQVLVALDKGLSPTWTWMATDQLGRPVTKAELARRTDEVRGGAAWYIGCNDDQCMCQGKWKWFDERNHDKMMGKVGVPVYMDV